MWIVCTRTSTCITYQNTNSLEIEFSCDKNFFIYIFRTPEKLHTWTKTVVDAYHLSKEGTLIREARDLMSPEIIEKLEKLMKVVERNFM